MSVCRLAAAWLVAAMVSAPYAALAGGIADTTMPTTCMDGMETAPVEDDLAPIEVSADGGCMVSETLISI